MDTELCPVFNAFVLLDQLLEWCFMPTYAAPAKQAEFQLCTHMVCVALTEKAACGLCAQDMHVDQDVYACGDCGVMRVHVTCWREPCACTHCGVTCVQ